MPSSDYYYLYTDHFVEYLGHVPGVDAAVVGHVLDAALVHVHLADWDNKRNHVSESTGGRKPPGSLLLLHGL